MKSRSVKFISVAALLLGSLGVASAAHARSDVFFSIGVQAPGVYVEPAPVYVQPQPVYVNPGYVESRPVYVTPRIEYRHEDDWRRHGWRHWEERRHARGPYGDADRDGVLNRFDRAPANPYRY
jgi:hypothetical protein